MFGHSSRSHRAHHHGHHVNPDRRAAGLKAALHNPNTTHEGREEAKRELRMMGRGNEAHGHPSLSSRIRSMLGIRSKNTRRHY
ncbi:hypothetical protein BOTBODRAFT_37963 [Botryobasidium botryosum FD-172 SS1]|uniref:Uncharacterized protein n=1 Tax=Botryobasidium botryosum (strain FD-172 SS1) TaxID=930990 RepID=A0A067M9X8_BOTB1|nr:hypothetical protein BOTBODRAFT_37963 [Botryobasidium botryosum FD-172 SS1]